MYYFIGADSSQHRFNSKSFCSIGLICVEQAVCFIPKKKKLFVIPSVQRVKPVKQQTHRQYPLTISPRPDPHSYISDIPHVAHHKNGRPGISVMAVHTQAGTPLLPHDWSFLLTHNTQLNQVSIHWQPAISLDPDRGKHPAIYSCTEQCGWLFQMNQLHACLGDFNDGLSSS